MERKCREKRGPNQYRKMILYERKLQSSWEEKHRGINGRSVCGNEQGFGNSRDFFYRSGSQQLFNSGSFILSEEMEWHRSMPLPCMPDTLSLSLSLSLSHMKVWVDCPYSGAHLLWVWKMRSALCHCISYFPHHRKGPLIEIETEQKRYTSPFGWGVQDFIL